MPARKENDLRQLQNAAQPYERWKEIILLSRRHEDTDAAEALFKFFSQCPETFWRLLALFAIDHLYEGAALPPQMLAGIASFLSSKDGVLLRGLVGFLANRKQAALKFLIDFIQTDQRLMIREDILTAAVYHAADGDRELLGEFANQNPDFALYCRHRIWPENSGAKFDIFPYSDYLYGSALDMGLSKKQFKSLYYLPRES